VKATLFIRIIYIILSLLLFIFYWITPEHIVRQAIYLEGQSLLWIGIVCLINIFNFSLFKYSEDNIYSNYKHFIFRATQLFLLPFYELINFVKKPEVLFFNSLFIFGFIYFHGSKNYIVLLINVLSILLSVCYSILFFIVLGFLLSRGTNKVNYISLFFNLFTVLLALTYLPSKYDWISKMYPIGVIYMYCLTLFFEKDVYLLLAAFGGSSIIFSVLFLLICKQLLRQWQV
jgi:hypothetical protein